MKSRYLRDIRNSFREELIPLYPPLEINSIFQMLIAHQFGFDRTILAMEPHLELKASQAEALLDALDQLKNHRPVQYIIGTALFMGMPLAVNSAVLIPRPETEELVTWLGESYARHEPAPVILDAGTGSGCIALGLKMQLPHAQVYGMDVSEKALVVARENAQTQNLEVSFLQGDLRNPGPFQFKLDVLVSNPPYIPERERDSMQPHVLDSEPHLALFVPDDDPLKFYNLLSEYAILSLKDRGWIYLETHYKYAENVGALLGSKGFHKVEIKKDIFGKNRFVRAQWHPVQVKERMFKE